ncbi:MAG: AIPR family protein [Lachnospiraceae bacterium]|nr:AIPR family protein [Lachnospiraceae bacterium]
MDSEMRIFRKQIEEDIKLIQKDYGNLDPNLRRDEFAFNYWILSRLYNLDEEIIPSNVTDIKDQGIDCFVHYEDTKELYLIQNKYYSERTPVSSSEVADFLYRPLHILLAGNYKRSTELQKIFNRACLDPDYKIWLHFYVSNDLSNEDVESLIKGFSCDDARVKAYIGVKYYKLTDIKRLYFEERFTEKVSFTATLTTRVQATSLDVRPEQYGLDWMIDLRFVMANVVDLYTIYKEAQSKNYELFEENVREYLGTRGINNGIINTLKSPQDRENFFYYNNGITLICEKCKTLHATAARDRRRQKSNDTYGFELTNPQIVNGCQTINSIAEVLDHCSEEKMADEYSRAYVLVKIYVFDKATKEKKPDLDKNIVKYTNSQNGVDGKAFASKKPRFLNLQEEFKRRGILLLVKPSDKNIFTGEYKDKAKFAELRAKSADLFKLFGVDDSKLNNYMIPLEKLLKVLLAFEKDGYHAFTKGSSVLKPNSQYYKDFALKIDELLTVDNMIRLYFLFNRADIDQKANKGKKIIIPYYVLGFLGKNFEGMEYSARDEKLGQLFASRETWMEIYKFYSKVTGLYTRRYQQAKGEEYNVMIKQPVDNGIREAAMEDALDMLEDDSLVRQVVKN